MSDPHGWIEQGAQIRAQEAAAAQRAQHEQAVGGHLHHQQHAGAISGQQHVSAPTYPRLKKGRYWAYIAWCPEHDRWGCTYRQRSAKDGLFQAFSAASGRSEPWCPGVEQIRQRAGLVWPPGYLMVYADRSGAWEWRAGRYRRWMARRLRRRLGAGPELKLLVSVRRGVLTNDGLDLTVGWPAGQASSGRN